MTPRSITLELPMPPSANDYWRFVAKVGRPLLSRDARDYRERIEKLLALWDCRWRSQSRIAVDVTLRFDSRRLTDIDNRIKPLLDALATHVETKGKKRVMAGVFENDSQVDELVVRRGPIATLAGVAVVVIRELPQVQSTLALEVA